MILARKIIKIPEFLSYLPPKINKIPEFYMIFARKMPEFYTRIGRKIFFPNFMGHVPPCPPPVSYAWPMYARGYTCCKRN